MFAHVTHKEDTGGSVLHGVMLVLATLAVAALAAAYARTVLMFIRVFVRVFLEELRAQPGVRRKAARAAANE